MRTILQYILLIVLVLGLSNCTKDSSILDSDTVNVAIDTRTSIGDISQGITFNNIRILSVRQNGLVVYNNLFSANKEELSINLVPDTYNIYIIANEATNLNLSNIKQETELNSILVDFSSNPTPAEANIICFGKETNVIIKKGTNNSALISKDNGVSWQNIFSTDIKRVQSKLSLYISKQTSVATDKFAVKSVNLINIPEYNYLVPKVYSNTNYIQKSIYNGSIDFISNSATFQSVTLNNIIPESITSTTNVNNIMALEINVDYTPSSSNIVFPIKYTIPILGYTPTDFNIYRNTHYKIYITITDRGTINYLPYCQIEVSNWDNADNPITNIDIGSEIYNYNWNWSLGTEIGSDGIIWVRANSYVEFNLNLISPAGATWNAYLGNTSDFDFDVTGGAVISGYTNPDAIYKIRIKTKKAVSTNNVQTSFYIVVDNGITQKRLGFNGKTSLTIKQIAS